MSTQPQPSISPCEYLERERAAEFKSEYFRGEMFAMAGASRRHNQIVSNVVREVGNSLKGRPCEIYPSDLRVKVSATGLYTYPDAVVVCGESEFEDDHLDTLLNPTVLFEVLSESTECYDRGTKVSHYRRMPSLKEYVLIAQDRLSVEAYFKQPDNGWLLHEFDALDQVVRFASVDVSVPMSEIYRNVRLDDEASEPDGAPK